MELGIGMRVSFASLFIIVGTLAVVISAIVAGLWVARRRRDEELRAHGTPLLVIPPTASAMPLATATAGAARPPERPIAFHGLAGDATRERRVTPQGAPIAVIEDPVTATTGRFTPGAVAEVVHGTSLRFHRPAEGTLQFANGYLEVVGGPDAGHEVRFVQPPPGESADITFGRKEGPAYRHVQLLEPTVSRTHARLSREGDRWRLTNLSRTNPVVVNGASMDGVQASQLLEDNDLVEMGALVFRFRAR